MLALVDLLSRDGFFAAMRKLRARQRVESAGGQAAAFSGKGEARRLSLHERRSSQVDTFDPKPALTRHHGEPYKGDLRWVRTCGPSVT